MMDIKTLEEAKYFMQQDAKEIQELRMLLLKRSNDFRKAAYVLKAYKSVVCEGALESSIVEEAVKVLEEAGV